MNIEALALIGLIVFIIPAAALAAFLPELPMLIRDAWDRFRARGGG